MAQRIFASKARSRADMLSNDSQNQSLAVQVDHDLMRPPEEKSGGAQDDAEAREDARLLYAIAGEDQQALAILYRRRGDLVYSFLLRMLGNSVEAQEVLQDTF